MKFNIRKPLFLFLFFLVLSVFALGTNGCSVGSAGIQTALGLYLEFGEGGYSGVPSGLPFASLACKITWPPSNSIVEFGDVIWIYGVVFREGVPVDTFPWGELEWLVDGRPIGKAYYVYDRTYPEVWVRFPFDTRVFGPGWHYVSFTALDMRDVVHPVLDSICLVIG